MIDVENYNFVLTYKIENKLLRQPNLPDVYGYFGRIALYFLYLAFGAAIFLKTERPNEVELCAAAQNISNIYMTGNGIN